MTRKISSTQPTDTLGDIKIEGSLVGCGGMFWAPMSAEVSRTQSFFIAMETEMLGLRAGVANQSVRKGKSVHYWPAHQLYF